MKQGRAVHWNFGRPLSSGGHRCDAAAGTGGIALSDTARGQKMNRPSDNCVPQTPDAFAGHLRRRAEDAAAASVQHARLSEQYLELSRRFAELAEQAASTPPDELRAALPAVESSLAAVPPATSAAPVFSTEQGGGSEDRPSSVTESPKAVPATDAAGIVSPDSSPDSLPESSGDAREGETPDPVDRAGRRRRWASGRATGRMRARGRRRTRSLVERLRSARLTMISRVRLKVRQDDLKPLHRTALDELNRSRGSLATSVVLILLTLFVLSLVTLQIDSDPFTTPIMASFAEDIVELDEPLPVEIPDEETGRQQEEDTELPVEEPEPEPEPVEEPSEDVPEEPEVDEPTELTENMDRDATEDAAEEPDAPSVPAEGPTDEHASFADSRSAAARQRMLEKYGGSAASESAVQRALEWFVSVQHPQGWWDFTHTGPSGDSGTVNNPIGGTAYALLPFLAAGQTHRTGSFRRPVRAGLDYLLRIGIRSPHGYDLRGVLNKGNQDAEPNEAYYVHGAATLVLCEAFAMTRDRRLRRPAEEAVRFLIRSQDPRGGGWRYVPGQAGSTSVTAIQVMALMAARKAGFRIPDSTLDGIRRYLDSVQIDGRGRYAYRAEKKTFRTSATAMALLSRMYLGWGRDDGDLRAGIELLDGTDSFSNRYTTYFVAQVLRNWGGAEWDRWNERMQADLLAAQETEGPARGSWAPRSGMHTRAGGRLLETSLATLTLEVYYRYRPLLPDPPGTQVASD